MLSQTILSVLFCLAPFNTAGLLRIAEHPSLDIPNIDQQYAPGAEQDKTPAKRPASSEPPESQELAAIPSAKNVKVCEVHKLGYKNKEDDIAGLGDMITLYVRDARNLTLIAKCLTENDQRVDSCREQQISLFLDGRKIKGLAPESGAPRIQIDYPLDCALEGGPVGTLQFHLERTAESDEAWADLLGAPGLDSFFIRPTEVSVGLEHEFPVETNVRKDKRFRLIRIRKGYFVISLLVFLSMATLLVRLAVTTSIVRDIGPRLKQNESPPGNKAPGPYSLARCQMAWWFFWVVGSYLFIWLITGALDIITVSTLTLLGIGAGTALGSAVVEVGRNRSNTLQFQSLKGERETLVRDIASLEAQIKSTQEDNKLMSLPEQRRDLENRLNTIDNKLGELGDPTVPKMSQGFIKDVLSETDDISFHRFQMFVWTIVLSIIFVSSVYNRLSMPEFSATLLALQGIVAGTYLGFKIQGT